MARGRHAAAAHGSSLAAPPLLPLASHTHTLVSVPRLQEVNKEPPSLFWRCFSAMCYLVS